MTRWWSSSWRYEGPAAGSVRNSERSNGWYNKWDNKRNDGSAMWRNEDYSAGNFLGATAVSAYNDREREGRAMWFAGEVCYIITS